MSDHAARALFEYEHGTGWPKGARWSNADHATRGRYISRAQVVIKANEETTHE